MTVYVAYVVETTARVGNWYTRDTWPTMKGARRAANKHERLTGQKCEVIDMENFRVNVEKQVERVNMMTGKKYMEALNTPGFMSPSSEAYWSM